MEISIFSLIGFILKLLLVSLFSLFWFFIIYFTDEPNPKHNLAELIILIIPILILIDTFFIGFIQWKM